MIAIDFLRNTLNAFSFPYLERSTVDDTCNSQSEDEVLAIQMSQGNDQAFEWLYHRYIDQIFGFIKRRVDSYEVAEDLVSSVFLKVFASRTRFTKGSFKAWVYRIANNTLIDFYRTQKNTISYEPNTHDRATSAHTIMEHMDQQSLRALLEHVISKLDTRSQTVLQLKFFAELSHEEIALTLNITANHVGVIIHRALKKIAKTLPPYV